MDEKELTQFVKSMPVAVAQGYGLSEGLVLAIRQGRRGVSRKTAKKLGFERRVTITYEPIQPAPETDAGDGVDVAGVECYGSALRPEKAKALAGSSVTGGA